MLVVVLMATESVVSFKLLVLGGTGFVGRQVVKRARQKGMSVVSISRRGKLVGETDESVTWVAGDAAETKTVQAIIDDFGPFDGCVHAVGVLLGEGQMQMYLISISYIIQHRYLPIPCTPFQFNSTNLHCIPSFWPPDAQTGISSLNRFASGSGSVPTSDSTYDRVIRQTGMIINNYHMLSQILVS